MTAATLRVTKEGFFEGSRSFVPVGGSKGVNKVKIKLIKKNPTGSFAATIGGTINYASAGKIRGQCHY